MFRHVIVGVDGRPAGRDAIALARILVEPGGHLALGHVHELTALRAVSGGFDDAAREASTRLLEREREATAVDAQLISVASSSAGRGLHELVETEDADLLVVGSCARGFAGRVLLGNDTRASLNGASCAVAVAPLGYADQPAAITTVGVGYNGSPESESALALARAIATQHGATVRALDVVQLPTMAYAGYAGAGLGTVLEDLLTDAKAHLAALDGVDGEALLGLASEELAAFAAQVDLLVVGSRGYGPLRRVILGSTSTHLASHARCPLLVLPRLAHLTADQPSTDAAHATSTAA
jgi:nucleotide-binding universal stress UspA family protein